MTANFHGQDVLKGILRGESFRNTRIDGDEPKPDSTQEKVPESGPAPGFAHAVIHENEQNVIEPSIPDNDEFDIKEPEFYVKQFIEENGGELLDRKQIKHKIREIEKNMKSDSPMTDTEYHELNVQRNVLIGMLYDETY